MIITPGNNRNLRIFRLKQSTVYRRHANKLEKVRRGKILSLRGNFVTFPRPNLQNCPNDYSSSKIDLVCNSGFKALISVNKGIKSLDLNFGLGKRNRVKVLVCDKK